MDLKIAGKRALVMGSSSGLGLAIAQTLIQEGAKVALCAKNELKLKNAATEIGAAAAFPCDLNQPQAARHLVQSVLDQFGKIDILICNTGGPPKGNFTEISTEHWQTGFQGLWMSTVDAIQGVLPGMKAQNWGRILLVTSVAAKEAMAHLTVSNGLRAGLLGLTKSLSHEIAPHGITVNAVLPGYTRTERLRELGIAEEKMTSQIPAGRLATPQEFAALTVFLASEQAGYVNGQAIACDGAYMRSI